MTGNGLGFPALVHLGLFAVALPWIGWRASRGMQRRALPPRRQYFASVIIQQVILGVFSLLVAWSIGLDLFGRVSIEPIQWVVGFAVLAIAVLIQRPRWDRAVRSAHWTVYLKSPRDAGERVLWVGISICAGVFEEITYRGVLFAIVAWSTGSPWVSAVFCSVVFGLGHLVQGWTAVAIITLFAAAFHGLVAWTGSLYLAMAVHVVYDVIAGFEYGRLAKRHGLPDRPPAPDQPAIDLPARTPS